MSKKNYNFYAFLSRMKFITRWGLMRNTYTENIQEHSLQVAIVAHALAIIQNTHFGGSVNPERVAVLGMFHDCDEIITGDLPTPIKYYNPQIKKAYKDIEEIAKDKLLEMLPREFQGVYGKILKPEEEEKEHWRLVKCADRLAALIKCIEEEKAGNKEFIKASSAILKTINELNSPEVNYFMEHFMTGFKLTLDEME